MDAATLRSTLPLDLGLVGALLLLGVLLRARIRALQRLMLPAPVISGIIGFLLGPNVLGFWTWSLPFSEYVGSYTTSAAMGDVFAANGQPEVTSVAFTAATVGMLTGVVGGVILARIGASRGHARAVDISVALPKSLRTGLLEDEERKPSGMHTLSGSSVESLTFHIALVGAVVAIGLVI